jgi:hypothetical protein
MSHTERHGGLMAEPKDLLQQKTLMGEAPFRFEADADWARRPTVTRGWK